MSSATPLPDEPAQHLHPKIRVVWLLTAFAIAIFVIALTGVAVMSEDAPPAIVGGVALVLLPFAWILPALHYRHWRYEIRDRDVYIVKGWIVRNHVLMPFDRIQFVETKQGPLDRVFELTQLVIKTAGGNVSIPGLSVTDATRLRERLSSIVGTLSV